MQTTNNKHQKDENYITSADQYKMTTLHNNDNNN